jgi:acetolactate synthase-1/2/3 large subunit
VAIASNGPGVANALPGVAVEQAEGNRVLLITSSRRDAIIYPDRGGAYQYFPHCDVIRPMAKWSQAVTSPERVAELLRKALRAAMTGRPGVVHLDVPETILNGSFPAATAGMWAQAQSSLPPLAPAPEQIEQAATLLLAAKRPLLHAGSGVIHADASDELRDLAALLDAPITTSWGGRAALDERWPQAVPMLYVDAVNQARRDADLVLVLGSRLGETDWWGKAPYWAPPGEQKLIQVDVDPDAIGRNRPADLPIQADLKATLRALTDELRTRRLTVGQAARKERVAGLRGVCAARRAKLDEHLKKQTIPMHPAHVATICQAELPEDAILVVDGGNTSIWAHFYHECRTPGSVVGTPKMGMLGAGVAQALGAKAAFPDRVVYCIIGDGAMGFHPQEVETAVRNDLPVIYLVLCDKQWGMVKMNQQFALKPVKTLVMKSLSPEETINADLGEIEFDQLARAMGAYGGRVADAGGLANAVRRAVASKRPAVIHVDVDPVAHMWAPNLRDFKDMHQEPKA